MINETKTSHSADTARSFVRVPGRNVCLLGGALLLALEGLFLWFFFIPPYNIFLRLGLAQVTVAAAVCTLIPRFRKRQRCCAALFVCGLMFLATPVAWDGRLATMRYALQIELFPTSLDLKKAGEISTLSSSMGERLEIEQWQVPGQKKYVFKKFDDDSCFMEMANISDTFVLRYGVCPSGTGALWISKLFLRYW